MTYDQSSYDLAESFLEDDDRFRRLPSDELKQKKKDALAQEIQTVIEDFLNYEL